MGSQSPFRGAGLGAMVRPKTLGQTMANLEVRELKKRISSPPAVIDGRSRSQSRRDDFTLKNGSKRVLFCPPGVNNENLTPLSLLTPDLKLSHSFSPLPCSLSSLKLSPLPHSNTPNECLACLFAAPAASSQTRQGSVSSRSYQSSKTKSKSKSKSKSKGRLHPLKRQ